ncbi:MAG: DUF4412 domain-containing protein [Allomuricauda sp.]
MKNKYLAVLLVLFTITVSAQTNFEGVIKYNLEFQDKTGEMSSDETLEFMGDQQTYYIKGNKYKSAMNGMLKVTQYYTGRDTLYNKMLGVNGLMYIDAKQRTEQVLSADIKENQLSVAGYSCDLLEIKTNEGTTLYYYNEAVKVNPEDYKNHQYGLWHYCLEKTGGALPLKMITDVADVKLSIEAKIIETKNLDDSIFEIPKGLPIVKSPG